MKRTDAPPPGWYPDPTGRRGLLWWDGLDWGHDRRPLPAELPWDETADGASADASDGDGATTTSTRGGAIPTATQMRSRAAAEAKRRRDAEREVADAVAEARRVAKAEVDRAVAQATKQLTETRDQWQPRFERYARRVKRWSRIVAVVVVVFVALSAWSGATLQTSLLEWLGERIDAVTATTAVTVDGPADHRPTSRSPTVAA